MEMRGSALNTLEMLVLTTSPDQKGIRHDQERGFKRGSSEESISYTISPGKNIIISSRLLHKSLRGSDPDAALYWLGRMLEAGEDPLYIARRMIRFASEDVGNGRSPGLTGGGCSHGGLSLYRPAGREFGPCPGRCLLGHGSQSQMLSIRPFREFRRMFGKSRICLFRFISEMPPPL